MAQQKPSLTPSKLLPRLAVSLAVLAAAGYVLRTHWPTVQASLQATRHAAGRWLLLALGLMALTLAIAAALYGTLALHRLRFRDTLLIEVAASCVNRLLPSGLGGLGLHGLYLYRRHHSPAEATAVVSVNNLIGMAAHLLLLGLTASLFPGVLRDFLHSHLPSASPGAVLIALLVAAVVGALPAVRRRVGGFIHNVLQSLSRLSAASLLRALLLALLLTATYTGLLYASARAVGVQLGPVRTFIVFSLGMLASAVTPTPGGLVGTEAGLYAGLVAYRVGAVPAGAAVLLFRLISYWLPLLPGAVALLLAKHRKLL